MHAVSPTLREPALHGGQVGVAHLQHRAELLAEERSEIVGAHLVEGHARAGAAREGHLDDGREEAAVRTVVVGEQQIRLDQAVDRLHEGAQPAGVVDVRRLASQLGVDLRERRCAQAVAAGTEIHEQQGGGAGIGPQLRRARSPHVAPAARRRRR